MGNRFFCVSFLNFLLFLPRRIIKHLPPTNGKQVFYLLPVFIEFHCLISLLSYAFSLEGKTRGNTDGNIAPVCRNSQIGPHVRCDIECRPGEKPKCDDCENDT